MRSAIGAKDHRARKEEEWSEGKDFSRIKKKSKRRGRGETCGWKAHFNDVSFFRFSTISLKVYSKHVESYKINLFTLQNRLRSPFLLLHPRSDYFREEEEEERIKIPFGSKIFNKNFDCFGEISMGSVTRDIDFGVKVDGWKITSCIKLEGVHRLNAFLCQMRKSIQS